MTASTPSPPLTGAIPRIERQQSHHSFLWAVRPPVVMVDLIHAARIAMHNDEAFFPPETDVILTSTVSDTQLSNYTFEDELRIIRELAPRWVLPFDFPVYGDMDPTVREEHTRQVATGAEDMQYILHNLSDEEVDRVVEVKGLPRELVEPVQNTTVLPLLKGTTPGEREIVFDAATRMQSPLIAKYGVQYMTVGGSGSHPALCDDLQSINQETGGHPTLVIGLLSPSGRYSLEGVPDNVVAAAGTNQWVKRVNPKSSSSSEMREAFEAFYNAVSETLDVNARYHASIAAGTPDKPPTEFEKSPGNAVGDDLSPSISGAAGDSDYGFGQRKRPSDAIDAVTAGRKGGLQSPTDTEQSGSTRGDD